MGSNPAPPEYPQISPYLVVDDAEAAISFYREVLGAHERLRIPMPDGRLGHAELQIGSGLIMIADEYPEMGIQGPKALGGSAVTISVYVDDVDATFAAAVAAGATVVEEVSDRFYGDRAGQFIDPFGHRWSVATHVEDVAHDEMLRRAEAMFG